MHTTLLVSILIGTGVGVIGTGAGGVLAYGIRRPGKSLQAAIMSLSGGVMVAMVVLSMLPEAFASGYVWGSVLGLSLSAVFVIALSNSLKPAEGKGRYVRTGLMVISAIAVHNFPEGLAIGSGLSFVNNYSLELILLMMLHDIPEGMAAAVSFRAGGVRAVSGVLYVALTGLPTGLGAALGFVVGGVSPAFASAALAFAGGTMLLITLMELLPGAREFGAKKGVVPVATAVGFALGTALIALF